MASILTSLVLATQASYSLYMKALSWTTLAAISLLGFSEAVGNHLGYSKFFNFGPQNRAKVPGKLGMLILYTPSLLAGFASLTLILPHHNDVRFALVNLALTLHYFKRVFEVRLCISLISYIFDVKYVYSILLLRK